MIETNYVDEVVEKAKDIKGMYDAYETIGKYHNSGNFIVKYLKKSPIGNKIQEISPSESYLKSLAAQGYLRSQETNTPIEDQYKQL